MADWTTPNAIHSKCGETAGTEAVLAKDDDTATYWRHLVNYYHWIIFDMGETKRITKIRLFQDEVYSTRYWGQEIGLYVYVSDDPEDFGDAVWEGALNAAGWQESGDFDKNGRYIKLVSKHETKNQRMYEFDAYVVLPVTEKFSSDSGSGIDTKTLTATLAKLDVGSGQDIVAQAEAILQGTESGSGTDSLTQLLAFITKSDSGSGIEALLDRALALSDIGAGEDITILAGILFTLFDIGTGSDTILSRLVAKSDSGTGIESIIDRVIALADLGTGVEAILDRAIALIESGIGAETSVLLANLTAEDAAITAEIASLISAITSTDDGTGSEAIISRLLTLLDTGIGSDVAVAYLTLMATDSGVGSEAIISRLMTLADSGTGLEAATRLGRLLRAIIITSQYPDVEIITAGGRVIRLLTGQGRIKAITSIYRKVKSITGG